MAEYINKKTALDAILAEYPDAHYPEWYAAKIKVLPAADVVPVVSCKDCKYRVYKHINEEIGDVGGCIVLNRVMANDDFCSYGERKDGGADNG